MYNQKNIKSYEITKKKDNTRKNASFKSVGVTVVAVEEQ
jgi:hypothetical protein